MGLESESRQVSLEVPSGIVSWWRFENDASDLLGINNAVGGNIIDDSERGKVIGFGDALSINDPAGLSISNNVAVSFWIKATNEGDVIKKGDNYKISVTNDGMIKFDFGNNEIISNDPLIDLRDGNWYHVVAENNRIYINGEPKGVSEIQTSSSINSDPVVIGGFQGSLDELMFFNLTLAINQVEYLYNSQK